MKICLPARANRTLDVTSQLDLWRRKYLWQKPGENTRAILGDTEGKVDVRDWKQNSWQRKDDEEGGTGDWTEEGKIVPASLWCPHSVPAAAGCPSSHQLKHITLWWNNHTHTGGGELAAATAAPLAKKLIKLILSVCVYVCLQCSQVACSNHMLHCRSTAQPSGRKKKVRWSLFLLFLRRTFSGCFCYFM